MLNQEEQKVLEFLKAWIEWVDAGADKHEVFRRGYALCISYDNYHNDASMTLYNMFISEGLMGCYPFTIANQAPDTCIEFATEEEHETMHLNPRRLAWVRKTITRLESQVDAWEVDQLNSPM